MASSSFSHGFDAPPPDDAVPGGQRMMVEEASKLQKDMHSNLKAAFAKGMENSSYERAMLRFAQGEMGWSDLFAGTQHAAKMEAEDGPRVDAVHVPGVRTMLRGEGWDMSVGGTRVVCDTPFVFERKDRPHGHEEHEEEEEDDEDDEEDGENSSSRGSNKTGNTGGTSRTGKSSTSMSSSKYTKLLGWGPNRHSNRLWVQMMLDWSLSSPGEEAEGGDDNKTGDNNKAMADLFYMEEAAYAFALQAVLHCINACDTSFVDVDPANGRLMRRDIEGFEYAFFKEKTYKEAGRVCGTFVGLHKGHMVAAFVHKRRQRHGAVGDPLNSRRRGTTLVTMDLCKIAYECCLPGSFPFSSIVNRYPMWKDEMPEDDRPRTRMPVWRCIVTPREMLEMRRDYADAMVDDPEAVRVLLLPSRNVQTLHDFHFAIDLESMRVLLRFQIAALLVKRYNMTEELVDPFVWHTSYSGDPARLHAAGRKMERILKNMLRKKDIVLK